MKKSVGVIFSFFFGAAVGSGLTYYFNKNRFAKEKDEFYENEVKPARDEYINKTKELAELNRIQKEKMSEMIFDAQKELKYISNEPDEQKDISDISKGNGFIQEPEIKIAEPEFDMDNAMDIPRDNGPNIYQIDSEDFGSLDGYSQEYLIYNINNGVVTDSYYSLIKTPTDMIGTDAIANIPAMYEKGIEIFWIRNDDTLTDYEVQLADYSFE